MAKSSKIIIILLTVFVLAMGLLLWLMPKSINWSPSYNTKDKTPLGLYVLDKEIDSLFGTWVERVKYPINDYFYDDEPLVEDDYSDSNVDEYDDDYSDQDSLYNQTIDTSHYHTIEYGENIQEDDEEEYYSLLYINQHNKWIQEEVKKVCNFVYTGNEVFISSIILPLSLLDSLDIELNATLFKPEERIYNDTIELTLRDHSTSTIKDKNGITGSFITRYDTSNTEILGHIKKPSLSFPNFVKIKYGNGHFFIHTEPAAFTNYYMLTNQHHQYVEDMLSYITHKSYIVWSLNDQTSKVISDSPLRFILSQPPLKWAWYLILLGVLMFVVFNIRRTQRVIPILPKPTNTSVEFVKTIGNLYFMEGDIRKVIDRKIVHLFAAIRSDFHVNTETLDEKFVHLLQLKSGKDEKIVKKMIFLVSKHKEHDYTCTLDDLHRLNNAIEQFYQ